MALTATRARTLTAEIKSTFANLEEKLALFHSERGWEVMGYDSFLQWWDSELGDIPVSSTVRQWAVNKMADEAQYYVHSGRIEQGTIPAIAQAVGYAPSTVSGILYKSRERAKGRITGLSDAEMVQLSVLVPGVWRKNIVHAALQRDCSMADMVRPLIVDGMRERYGVDVAKPVKPSKAEARKGR